MCPIHRGTTQVQKLPRGAYILLVMTRSPLLGHFSSYGVGGYHPLGHPPTTTKVTLVANTEIYRWGNLVGPFLVHSLSVPRPPSLSITSLMGGTTGGSPGPGPLRQPPPP